MFHVLKYRGMGKGHTVGLGACPKASERCAVLRLQDGGASGGSSDRAELEAWRSGEGPSIARLLEPGVAKRGAWFSLAAVGESMLIDPA